MTSELSGELCKQLFRPPKLVVTINSFQPGQNTGPLHCLYTQLLINPSHSSPPGVNPGTDARASAFPLVRQGHPGPRRVAGEVTGALCMAGEEQEMQGLHCTGSCKG